MTNTNLTNLYHDSWQIRVSDPGEEGAHSHLFDTTSVKLDLEVRDNRFVFHFLRKTEERVEQQLVIEHIADLFKLMSEYMDPIALGLLGVKIGRLGAEKGVR